MGQKLCLNASPIFFFKGEISTVTGKISAQPHTTLCIQFLDRENNDKTIHCPWENRFVMGLCGNLPSFPPKISTARCFRKFRVDLIYVHLTFRNCALILCHINFLRFVKVHR